LGKKITIGCTGTAETSEVDEAFAAGIRFCPFCGGKTVGNSRTTIQSD
jgi:hypothetical protein